MQTILHQGRPTEDDNWLALPNGLAATYTELGYATRELVLRDDAVAELKVLRHAGAKMANVLFNLAQDNGMVVDANLRASLKKMQDEWDEALRSVSQDWRVE